jgi:hypothetical protein
LGPTARADLGARVTGEASPLVKSDASSVEIRSEAEERSSLRGSVGRWREEIEIAEGRRPGPIVELGVGERVGFGNRGFVDAGSMLSAADELGTGGREMRVDVGDNDADFERVRLATAAAALSASSMRRSSRCRSRCRTAIARS